MPEEKTCVNCANLATLENCTGCKDRSNWKGYEFSEEELAD